MKTLATFLGAIVLMIVGAPIFVWMGSKFFNGYSGYTTWIYGTLTSLIGR